MRFSSLFMKNPIERLSGDQNGRRAPSVPGKRVRGRGVEGSHPQRGLPLVIGNEREAPPVG